MFLGKQVVEKSGPGTTDVQRASRTGRKSNPHFTLCHASIIAN